MGHWHGRQSASESRRWYSVPVILNSQAHCVTATRCRATHRDSDWQSETAEVSPSPSQECFATGSLSGPGHGHPAVRRQCRGTQARDAVTITGRHSDFDISQSQVFDFRWYLLFNMYKSSQENVELPSYSFGQYCSPRWRNMGAENSRECKKSIRFSEIQSTYSGGNHDGVGQIGFSSSQSRLPFSTNAQSWRSLLAGTLVWISNTRLQSACDPDQVHILNQNTKQSTKFNVQTIYLIN